MKRIICSLLFLLPIIGTKVTAQSMTFLPDVAKRNQIQVMELGAGILTPDFYYNMFHKNYKKTAYLPTSPKNSLRMTTYLSSKPQVEFADSIEADLKSRAKIEALNLADRKVDLAWTSIGNKLDNTLRKYRNNINSLSGKTKNDEIEEWKSLADQYDFAIKTIKKAYLANSQRQKQYMTIYDEICKTNELLVDRVKTLTLKKAANRVLNVMSSNISHRVKEESLAGYNRWIGVTDKIQTKTTTQK